MHTVVNYLPDENIVEVIATGRIDHQKRKELICTVWAALDKNGCNKVLINKANSERMFDQEMAGALKIIRLMNDMNLFHETKIAILNKKIVQYDEFFEVMAQLKGISLKNFTNREIALHWLCRVCR